VKCKTLIVTLDGTVLCFNIVSVTDQNETNQILPCCYLSLFLLKETNIHTISDHHVPVAFLGDGKSIAFLILNEIGTAHHIVTRVLCSGFWTITSGRSKPRKRMFGFDARYNAHSQL
jgi:hypothetical protein